MIPRPLRSVLSGLSLLPISAGAQPVLKTGACPELARYSPPTGENWNQFPVRPNGFASGTLQKALEPGQSINCIQVPEGLRAELWASEKLPGVSPGLAYLQHFAFDERGRMWAVEPRSYPNIILPAAGNVNDQKFTGGTDRILILEDTDGDKVADKVKVFRDKLNLPQSIEVVNGGVVVTMAPYLVFFPNNGDTAGTPRILWNGLGDPGTSWDTHGSVNSLMYGLDNWIYGHSGGTGCNAGGVECGWGQVWRFRHTALGHAETKFESWTTGPANAWGIGQMEDGQIFQSGATGTPHINHSIRKGVKAIDIRFPAVSATDRTGADYYPITGDRYLWEGSTAKNAQGWYRSGTTAVSGLQFYTSRLLPPKYWSRFAFTCEGASKLCNQDSLVVSGNGTVTGSSWRAVRMPGPERSNLIASTDAWVAPILAKTGPDGAVWVLDWYNYLFLHNPANPMGPGKAWQSHLREKQQTRIYRVTPADGRTEPVLNLANASVAQLVKTFSNPNLHWRLQAQRLLLAKGWSADLGALLEAILTGSKAVDTIGNNPRVVHALWTLHGLGQFEANAARWNPILAKLLAHPAWGVRRNALLAMPRTAATAQAIGAQCAVNDPHGHVRLQALVALSQITSRPAGLPAIWDTYRDADGTAGTAAALLPSTGLAAAATRPCEPALEAAKADPPDESVGARRLLEGQPRSDLRFAVLPDGFRLLPHGQLPSGELTVSGPDGRLLFRSAYDRRSAAWSVPQARGLRQGIWIYRFRGEDGSVIRGRISPAAGGL